ncbi:MAG: zinc ribbon domain-containing protein [Candidatus Weimeria sp.]
MAGIFDSLSNGMAKASIKTNNMMEEARTKTILSSLKKERDTMASNAGYQIYQMWKKDSIDIEALKPTLELIDKKNEEIRIQEEQLEKINTLDQQVFGKHEKGAAADPRQIQPGEPTVYCPNCGSLNAARFKFCIKCGQPL